MFEIISSILKYAFTIIIYIFIFNVIRLILIDIRSMNEKTKTRESGHSYLKLVSVHGVLDFKIEEIYLLESDTSVGRSKENTICLDDTFLSASHAVFIKKKNGFYVKDSGSTNGTALNGKRIGVKPVRLKDGDRITLGRSEFLFVNDKRQGDK
jgi:hypothetical protein